MRKQIPGFPQYSMSSDGRVYETVNGRALPIEVNEAGFFTVRKGTAVSVFRVREVREVLFPTEVTTRPGDELMPRLTELEQADAELEPKPTKGKKKR